MATVPEPFARGFFLIEDARKGRSLGEFGYGEVITWKEGYSTASQEPRSQEFNKDVIYESPNPSIHVPKYLTS